MRYLRLLGAIICTFLTAAAAAQPAELQLARQYESNGDLQKAYTIYQKLYKQDNEAYYPFFINNLIAQKKLDEAESITKKLQKKHPDEMEYSLKLGAVYTAQGNADKATAIYNDLIKSVPANKQAISYLATQFYAISNLEWAVKTFEHGRSLLNDDLVFSRELVTLYRYKHDNAALIDEYLNFLPRNPDFALSVQSTLANVLNDSNDLLLLKNALLKRLQKQPNEVTYANLMVWLFLQQKNYALALNQALALNRRTNAATDDLLDLCRTLTDNGAFDEAIRGFEYIIAKGPAEPLFITAKIEVVNARSQKVTSGNYTQADLQTLEKDYQGLLTQFGFTRNTLFAIRKLAALQAFKLHKLPEAQTLLEQALKIPDITANMQALCKLDLGDVYLLNNRPWDATLLYSQVEKQKESNETEQEAKYRNAKLAYYTGDFDFAKGQLDVLKAATTKLIANDALNLELLINDELQADSTAGALKMYARADMHLFAGFTDKALATLDSINARFANNNMADDILMAKAKIFISKNNYQQAADMLNTLAQNYANSLWADDALYMLADLYEKHLNKPQAAKPLFEKIITDYPASLHINQARERFRALRGDAPGA